MSRPEQRSSGPMQEIKAMNFEVSAKRANFSIRTEESSENQNGIAKNAVDLNADEQCLDASKESEERHGTGIEFICPATTVAVKDKTDSRSASDLPPSIPIFLIEEPNGRSGNLAPDVASSTLPRKKSSADLLLAQPSRNPKTAVNIAVASRALFSLDTEFRMGANTTSQMLQEYLEAAIKDEDKPYPPGSAFPFIQALSHVNRCLLQINPEEQERFNIILMSHNHAHVGVKLIKSINHHDLQIERMCLTGGTTPVPHYLEAYNVSLFLTSYPNEVEKALECGFAAAMMSEQIVKKASCEQLRVAFDLDAVLFSDEAEMAYKSGGLAAFFENEQANVNKPAEEGPLKKFAQALGRMQEKFQKNRSLIKEPPIKVYIVTARSAASSGERAIKTLRAWGLCIDEIHFLAGAPKGPILNAIKPHIFFDDQYTNIVSAQEYGQPAAQVVSWVANKNSKNHSKAPCVRNLSLFECDDLTCTVQSPMNIKK